METMTEVEMVTRRKYRTVRKKEDKYFSTLEMVRVRAMMERVMEMMRRTCRWVGIRR